VDINAVIDEVARRHHIRLTPDDPILVTVSMIEIVHQVFAEHLRLLVKGVADQATDRLAAQIESGRLAAVGDIDAAKKSAATVINAAGGWSSDLLKAAAATAGSDLEAAALRIVETIDQLIRPAIAARRVAIIAAAICGGLCLLLGGVVLGRYLNC
jgi:hypothetical protein